MPLWLSLFLIWVFGFFALLSFDLFVEAFIFEWLEWNGTNKNDWFFVLWWGLVAVWTLYGFFRIHTEWKTFKPKSDCLRNFNDEFAMQNTAYKVLTLKEWDQAQVSGQIITELDQNDGFIHLSTATQLTATLALYFSSEKEAVLLQLEQSKISTNLKYELPIPPGKRSGAFPHFYGNLNTNTVSKVWRLSRNAFEVPIEILLQAEENIKQ